MIESKMQAVDRLSDVLTDLRGPQTRSRSRRRSREITWHSFTQVIDSDVDVLEAVFEWMQGLEQ